MFKATTATFGSKSLYTALGINTVFTAFLGVTNITTRPKVIVIVALGVVLGVAPRNNMVKRRLARSQILAADIAVVVVGRMVGEPSHSSHFPLPVAFAEPLDIIRCQPPALVLVMTFTATEFTNRHFHKPLQHVDSVSHVSIGRLA